jgi:hypothetical protein
MPTNSLSTNMLVTSILSQLASYPQPLLRAVLVHPDICLQPSVRGLFTGKSFLEAPIFASTNPQYDDSLFNDLQVQYEKITRYQEHVVYTDCLDVVSLKYRYPQKSIELHNFWMIM